MVAVSLKKKDALDALAGGAIAAAALGAIASQDHDGGFFFQAEDGIRDRDVNGVQTCALPIYERDLPDTQRQATLMHFLDEATPEEIAEQIGRASCRERV